GLLLALLDLGEQLLRAVDLALQPDFLDRERWNLPDGRGGRIDVTPQRRFPDRQRADERPGERRDRLVLQRVDRRGEPAQRRVRLAVAVPQGAQLRLLGPELAQGLGALRRLLSGRDLVPGLDWPCAPSR